MRQVPGCEGRRAAGRHRRPAARQSGPPRVAFEAAARWTRVNVYVSCSRLLGEERHLGHDLPAESRAHHAEVLDCEQAPRDVPLELVASANACQFVPVSAQQDEAAEFPAVRLKEDRLEALNLALLLETRVVLKTALNPSVACRSRPRTGAPKPIKSPKSAMRHSPLSIRRSCNVTCHIHYELLTAQQKDPSAHSPIISLPASTCGLRRGVPGRDRAPQQAEGAARPREDAGSRRPRPTPNASPTPSPTSTGRHRR